MKFSLSLLMALVMMPVFAVTAINLNRESHLSGPKLTPEELEGKVILLEFFGYGCGPCINAMPGTVALAKKYKKDGRLVVIASHLWGRKEDGIKAFLERTGATSLPTYQALTFDGVEKPGGVPHAVILGHDGEILWQGHPSNHDAMENALLEGLEHAPAAKSKKLSLKEQFEQRKAKESKKTQPKPSAAKKQKKQK